MSVRTADRPASAVLASDDGIALVRSLADGAMDAVVVGDLDGRIVHWNAVAEEMFGWSAREIHGATIGRTLVPERYRALHDRGLAQYAATGRSTMIGRRLPLQALCKDGSEVQVEMRVSRVDAPGSPLLVAFLRDLRESARARSRTSQAEAFAESVLAALESHVAVVSRDGTIAAVNERWRKFAAASGADPDLVGIGSNYLEACNRTPGLEPAIARQMHVGLLAVLDRVRARFTLEYPYAVGGQQRWFAMVVTPMQAPWKGVVVAHTDITERRAAEEAMRAPARADVLTGLPNRVLFADRLEQALLHRQRAGGQCAVLFIDLDNFKEVNDTFGHSAGDVVLCEVAHRFQHGLRRSDTVARFGGDEFVVLLPEVASRDAAAGVARKLLAALAPPVIAEGHAPRIEASIGIALAPEHGEDASTLLRHADVAMYAAKRSRRDIAVYAPDEDRA
jgi:diguanylate cyclase (GGDEF)-like protein/PAS domain S-box-containing protein